MQCKTVWIKVASAAQVSNQLGLSPLSINNKTRETDERQA
jgi:hypothetical protein